MFIQLLLVCLFLPVESMELPADAVTYGMDDLQNAVSRAKRSRFTARIWTGGYRLLRNAALGSKAMTSMR
jgi:hypothetical protein